MPICEVLFIGLFMPYEIIELLKQPILKWENKKENENVASFMVWLFKYSIKEYPRTISSLSIYQISATSKFAEIFVFCIRKSAINAD